MVWFMVGGPKEVKKTEFTKITTLLLTYPSLKKIRKLIFVFQSPNNCYKTVLFQHKALVAAQLENAIEKELLERLKKGTVSNGLLWHK